MTTTEISILLNSGSLLLGITGWIFAILAICAAPKTSAHRNTVVSFGCCGISLIFQLFEIGNRVRAGDYSAIEDTIRAVLLAAVVLVTGTMVLNLMAYIRAAKK